MNLTQQRSLHGLDWLNFFVANVQTGFGPFIAVYLTENRWTTAEIGFALTIGTICSLVSQVPAGMLVDAMDDKRWAVRFGVVSIGGTALLYALSTTKVSVYLAEVLHGLASSVIGPAIAAVSLALVGRAAFSERAGRNVRFASIGNGIAAGLMGAAGSFVSANSVFWLTAILGVPALLALRMIGPGDRTKPAAPTADPRNEPTGLAGLRELFLDWRLLVFGGCVLLFFMSNAAMLPLAATQVTKQHPELADVLIAATIVVPQLIVAAMSPWVGRSSDRWGRRPIMLLGWIMRPVQGILYAAAPTPYAVLVCQILGGVSAAVFGVTMTLVAADLTQRNGRFNLTLGALGVAIAVGASISTSLAGIAADTFGNNAAFLGLAVAGAAGTLLLWLAMPETWETPSQPPPAAALAVPVPTG
jgi:MFS family permease